LLIVFSKDKVKHGIDFGQNKRDKKESPVWTLSAKHFWPIKHLKNIFPFATLLKRELSKKIG